MELVPEVLIVEAEPTGYPRAPVSKKRVWIDPRNVQYVAYVTYDRRGELWKSFEPCYSQYVKGDEVRMVGDKPAWTWTHVHSHDIQTNRMSRFIQAKSVRGGAVQSGTAPLFKPTRFRVSPALDGVNTTLSAGVLIPPVRS